MNANCTGPCHCDYGYCDAWVCHHCGHACGDLCRAEPEDVWLADAPPVLAFPTVPRLPEPGEIDGPSFVYEDDYGCDEVDAAFWPSRRTLRALARLADAGDFEDEDVAARMVPAGVL